MNRFHVHVAVDDLAANIRFYSSVFGRAPSVTHPDYAKWMLDDPRINFAISSRGAPSGVDHLGLQVDSEAELDVLRSRVDAAEIAALDQADAACCYARSDKYWVTDPQGIAWETFHTLGDIPVFGATTAPSREVEPAKSGCCGPGAGATPAEVPQRAASAASPSAVASACCTPARERA
ncbi:MAG: VOC family protein [Burkholderiales bacterium]|jgi:catechol 2,3-dioxygenase-like lactoylglutathione lyase family enzyme|nr:VOC family protein [Burkholderiales bacterium]